METQANILVINEDCRAEAVFMSKTFVDKDIKRRVYVNTLGAECFMQYLSDNGINTDRLHNIHSITRIVEKADIADILLKNIHIDVRVIFDEDEIFVPKSHEKYGITPDIYVVAKIDSDMQNFELLGYFKPEVINKENSNKDYYFVPKNQIATVETLCTFIKNAKYKHEKSLKESEILRGRELSISTADHDITDSEYKEYIELLLSSTALRDSVSEYDNFETLSYDVIPILMSEDDDLIDENEEVNKYEETEDEEDSASSKDSKDAGAAIAGAAAVTGIAGAAAAAGEAITSAAATGKAIELAGNAGEIMEDLLDTDKKKEEPAPEISVEDVVLDEDLSVEPLEIDDLTTDLPLETDNEELIKEEISSANDSITDEQDNIKDEFDDFEEFENLAGPSEEITENATEEILPSDMITEEEIEVTEPSEVSETLDNSISPVDDEELFKDSEYDELFDESNPEEPTYNYAQHDETENKSNLTSENTSDDEDFLVNFEDFEKAEDEEKLAFENSTSISDKDIKVGEIPIDINSIQEDISMPSEHLEDIYNGSPDMVTDAPLNNSVMIGKAQSPDSSKKGALAGVGALVLLAGISFAAMKFMKPADQTANAPLPESKPVSAEANTSSENQNTINLNDNNVVNMDNNKSSTVTSQAANNQQPAKKIAATSFMSVRKLSWEVPDYISYNAAFRQYFQSAGKSLKSALSSDLLLADEYAYSDQVRVSVLFDKMGTFKESKILLSSGSAQVDKIVLQSVNQTLSVLKAPQSVGNDESTTVILKIYF